MEFFYATVSIIVAIMLVITLIAGFFFFAEEIKRDRELNPKPEAKILDFKPYGLSKWELEQTTNRLLREDRKRKNGRYAA